MPEPSHDPSGSPDAAGLGLTEAAAKIADLAARLPADGGRRLIAIAGAPGAGKSTLADAAVARLRADGHAAALMPMDGFHLDNTLLDEAGLRERKGAPETFDFPGFHAALKRLRREPEVVLPVFDRGRDLAIAGAARIGPETRLVVVEGNYLCLDEPPWRDLGEIWSAAVMLDVPLAELERRLVERWRAHGLDDAAAAKRAEGNDLPNARRVLAHMGRVDLHLS